MLFSLGWLIGVKKKTKVIDNNLDPVWNEVYILVLAVSSDHHPISNSLCYCVPMLSQTLQFDLPGGLTGSETLKIEVYDHETVGRNRSVIVIPYCIHA